MVYRQTSAFEIKSHWRLFAVENIAHMQRRHHRVAALTLLELVTVILIIAILSVIGAGLFSEMRTRAEKVKCVGNLKNLYAGAELYLQDQGHWPQVDTELLLEEGEQQYCQQWIDALRPYGFGLSNWLCPTHQRLLKSPDMSDAKNLRIDYLPMPFDDKTMTPHRWPKQPWFIERASGHAGGNLIIYTNGQVGTLQEAVSSR